jgi:excisionase family DNA binding protein
MKADEMNILTKKELAEMLKCEEGTIGNLVSSKQLPFFMVGREVRFLSDSIFKWLKERETKPCFLTNKGIG